MTDENATNGQRLWICGNSDPGSRCSIVWFGKEPDPTDKHYDFFLKFKEFPVEFCERETNTTEELYMVKCKGYSFVYRNLRKT